MKKKTKYFRVKSKNAVYIFTMKELERGLDRENYGVMEVADEKYAYEVNYKK